VGLEEVDGLLGLGAGDLPVVGSGAGGAGDAAEDDDRDDGDEEAALPAVGE